jgi:hypothetical protein
LKILSIRQPWAYLIAEGSKNIENRVWSTRYRGLFLNDAGKLAIISPRAWMLLPLHQGSRRRAVNRRALPGTLAGHASPCGHSRLADLRSQNPRGGWRGSQDGRRILFTI